MSGKTFKGFLKFWVGSVLLSIALLGVMAIVLSGLYVMALVPQLVYSHFESTWLAWGVAFVEVSLAMCAWFYLGGLDIEDIQSSDTFK